MRFAHCNKNFFESIGGLIDEIKQVVGILMRRISENIRDFGSDRHLFAHNLNQLRAVLNHPPQTAKLLVTN